MKAGYADELSMPNLGLTVFAPTNEAFVALLGDLGYSSLDEVPASALQQILLDHVLPAPVSSGQLAAWDVVDYRPTTFGYLTLDADRCPPRSTTRTSSWPTCRRATGSCTSSTRC